MKVLWLCEQVEVPEVPDTLIKVPLHKATLEDVQEWLKQLGLTTIAKELAEQKLPDVARALWPYFRDVHAT